MQLMFTPDVYVNYELVLENSESELNPTLSLSTITDVLSVTVRGLDVNRLAEQLHWRLLPDWLPVGHGCG